MKKRYINYYVIGTLLLILSFSGHSGVTLTRLSFDPSSQTGLFGQQVSADLTISGLEDGDSPSLSAFDLDVLFDPSILVINNVSFGNQLDLSNSGLNPSGFTPVTGMVNLFEVSLDLPSDLNNLQTDSFTLATLTFDTVSAGTSALTLSNVSLVDADGEQLLPPVFENGSITTVAEVPEPATLLLFGIGIVGLFYNKRNRRSLFCSKGSAL